MSGQDNGAPHDVPAERDGDTARNALQDGWIELSFVHDQSRHAALRPGRAPRTRLREGRLSVVGRVTDQVRPALVGTDRE